MKTKKAVRVWTGICGVTLCVMLLLVLFLTAWWFGFSYPYFDSVAAEGKYIPGTSSGLSPQGLCILPAGSPYRFAMSGYVANGPSRVYLIPEDDVAANVKKVEHYVTFTQNGEDIRTHFGGVTCSEQFLYIASGDEIVRVALEKVLSANSGSAVAVDDSFSVGFGAAYCYIEGGTLYVGEFYRAGNYETPPSHRIEMAQSVNRALVYCYELDETREGGIADMVPTRVLSVCNEVQGIAVTEDNIFLSCSYGLPDSVLRMYENPFSKEADGTFRVGEQDVPLYFLPQSGGKTMRLPCMSEEICFGNGRLYVLFESMSRKYRYVTFHRESYIASLSPDAITGAHGTQKAFFGIPVK